MKARHKTEGQPSEWWVMGFSHVNSMTVNEILDVPEWEPVADLILYHYGDA